MLLLDARRAAVGGGEVRRLLPHPRQRRLGAWCFVDHFGPSAGGGPGVGPHPHIGLQTVTWLIDGRMHHGDSLGSSQAIAPGELNLMTAGHGITHWERAPASGAVHGVQPWIALPESRRHGPPAFEHHGALPRTTVGSWSATVIVGELAGHRSPATVYTPLVGVELVGAGPARLPLRVGWEHGLVVLEGAVRIDGVSAGIGQAVVLDGPDVSFTADAPARVLLLGGEPFESPVLMWWNFVARTSEETAAAAEAWRDRDPRFGDAATFPDDRIDAPPTPHVRLVPS